MHLLRTRAGLGMWRSMCLTCLCVCAVQIRGKGAIAITKAVAGLPHLRSLLLDENEISESAIGVIQVTPLPPRLC